MSQLSVCLEGRCQFERSVMGWGHEPTRPPSPNRTGDVKSDKSAMWGKKRRTSEGEAHSESGTDLTIIVSQGADHGS